MSSSVLHSANLFGVYENVSELSKVLIERGYGHVLGRGSRGDQAVYEVDFRFSITIERIEVSRGSVDFHAGTRNKSAERGGDIPA